MSEPIEECLDGDIDNVGFEGDAGCEGEEEENMVEDPVVNHPSEELDSS